MIDEAKILAYLSNELDEEEQQAVAAAIEQDATLQQIVEEHRQIQQGFRAKRVAGLTERIEAYESSLPAPEDAASRTKPANGKPNGRWWLTGFLVVSLLVMTGIFIYGKTQYSNVKIAQRHFLMPNDPSVAGNQEATTFLAGLEAFFNDQDYQRAGELFASIPRASSYAPPSWYFLAHTDFLRGEYTAARAGFAFLSEQLGRYPSEQQRRIQWNAWISRLAAGEDITLPPDVANTPEGQALSKDLQSVWRRWLH